MNSSQFFFNGSPNWVHLPIFYTPWCLCEKLLVKPYFALIGPPNSQTRTSTQAVEAQKGSTSDGWQQACTTGKMSTISSSRHTSELWANSFHGWKVIRHRTSPQIIRTTGGGVPRLPAGLQSSITAKIRSPWWFGQEFVPAPLNSYGFRQWGGKNWLNRSPPWHSGRRHFGRQ